MSHAFCKPLRPAIKTSGDVCALTQEEPYSATDTTEQSIMGHNVGLQRMLSAALVHRRALRTCRQLKGGACPTPTYSHRHGRIGNSNGILVRRCWCGCAGQALQDEAGERLRGADRSGGMANRILSFRGIRYTSASCTSLMRPRVTS